MPASLVSSMNASSRPAPVDLDVARRRVPLEQRAQRRIRVGADERDRGAVPRGGCHAGSAGELARSATSGQRRADRPRPDARLDLGRRPVDDHLPVRHEHDPVGVRVRLVEVVRREEHRLPPGRELAHRVPERAARLDVHRDRRLVEHEQVGVGDEREREPRALRLAARELLGAPPGEGLEPGELDRLVDVRAAAGRATRTSSRARAPSGRGSASPVCSIAPTCPPSTAAFGCPAEDRDRACVGLDEAEQQVDRRRLAGAVRPEQRDGLAGRDRDVDPGDRVDRPGRAPARS